MAIFPLISLSIPGSFLNGFKLTMDAANLRTSLTNCSIKSISVYLENSLTIHNLKNRKPSVAHLAQVLVCCLAVFVSVVVNPQPYPGHFSNQYGGFAAQTQTPNSRRIIFFSKLFTLTIQASYQLLNSIVIIGTVFFALSQKIPNWQLLVLIRTRRTRTRSEICSNLTIKIPKRRLLTSFWCFYC